MIDRSLVQEYTYNCDCVARYVRKMVTTIYAIVLSF